MIYVEANRTPVVEVVADCETTHTCTITVTLTIKAIMLQMEISCFKGLIQIRK